MLGDITEPVKRKARTFLLDDYSTLTAVDRPPFQAYAEYPEKKRAILRLPLPYKKHRKLLQDARNTKEIHDSERFIAEFDEKDRKLVATPDAILGIHILELESISVRITNFDKAAPMFFYCLVSVGKKKKMTKVVMSYTPERVRMDATLFFPLEVSNTRDNYRNKLKFEIWAFQEPTTHFIIGGKDIHIYPLIQTVHSIDYCHIWAEGVHCATFAYEYAFAYGLFGFGHSNQLKNTKSSVFEAICRSMFPRIKLQDGELIDNKFNIRVPKKIQMIGMSNFLLYAPQQTMAKKGVSDRDDPIEPKFFCLHHVEFDRGVPIFAKVNIRIQQEEFEADFNEIFGEYICIASRRERLDFFHELLYGRLEDIQETEVGALWEDLDFDDAEHVIRAEDNPNILVYPRRPCKDFPPAFVEAEDETLYEGLPSLSRTAGWLARLFGYGSIETDPHHQEGDYPYTHVRGYTKHRQPGWQVCCQGLKYGYGKVTGAIWAVFKFIFPDLRSGPEIPDIAITLPSPQGSTTDLLVSWITDEREQYDYAAATRRIKDPVQEAYEAVNKLIYDDYEKGVHVPAGWNEKKGPSPNLDKNELKNSTSIK